MQQPEIPIANAETQRRQGNVTRTRPAKPLAAESWECTKACTPFWAGLPNAAGVSPENRSKAESANRDALHCTSKWIAEAPLHSLDPLMTAAN